MSCSRCIASSSWANNRIKLTRKKQCGFLAVCSGLKIHLLSKIYWLRVLRVNLCRALGVLIVQRLTFIFYQNGRWREKMKLKSIFFRSASIVLLVTGTANASTFVESTDFGGFFTPTYLGVLSSGINTFSGSLATTCVASSGSFADCSSGDESDSFTWDLPSGFEILDASVNISNYTMTGTLDSEQLGFGRIGFEDWGSDGNYVLNLGDAFLVPQNKATFEVSSATLTSPITLQGTGDIGFDYTLSLNVTASPVPVPAAVWLFGSALFGLVGMRKKVVNLSGKYA